VPLYGKSTRAIDIVTGRATVFLDKILPGYAAAWFSLLDSATITAIPAASNLSR
jgi:hypothetical protein